MADLSQVRVGKKFKIPHNSSNPLRKDYYIATVTNVLEVEVWGDWVLFTEEGVQVDVFRNHVCRLHHFENLDWEVIPFHSDKMFEDFL